MWSATVALALLIVCDSFAFKLTQVDITAHLPASAVYSSSVNMKQNGVTSSSPTNVPYKIYLNGDASASPFVTPDEERAKDAGLARIALTVSALVIGTKLFYLFCGDEYAAEVTRDFTTTTHDQAVATFDYLQRVFLVVGKPLLYGAAVFAVGTSTVYLNSSVPGKIPPWPYRRGYFFRMDTNYFLALLYALFTVLYQLWNRS